VSMAVEWNELGLYIFGVDLRVCVCARIPLSIQLRLLSVSCSGMKWICIWQGLNCGSVFCHRARCFWKLQTQVADAAAIANVMWWYILQKHWHCGQNCVHRLFLRRWPLLLISVYRLYFKLAMFVECLL